MQNFGVEIAAAHPYLLLMVGFELVSMPISPSFGRFLPRLGPFALNVLKLNGLFFSKLLPQHLSRISGLKPQSSGLRKQARLTAPACAAPAPHPNLLHFTLRHRPAV